MLCDDVRVNLPDYLLGKIEPNLKRGVESHLESCASCQAELEELRRPVEVLSGITQEEYPDAFWQELRAAIVFRVSRPSPSRWKVPALVGAMAVILLAVGVFVYRTALPPAEQNETVTSLASSLSSDQVVALPSLNTNYVDIAETQSGAMGEIETVDDSVQEAVVKSLWSAVADSTGSLENFDYSTSSVLN